MKKLFLSIIMLSFFFTSCEKEKSISVDDNKEITQKETNFQQKSMIDEDDPLVVNFSNLNAYLEDRNEQTSGEFFEYTTNNPDYTWEELETLGYVDLEYLQQGFENIQEAASDRDESEIAQIAQSVVNSNLIDFCDEDCLNPNPPINICLFCCRGCLDRIRHNHCITVVAWNFGPAC